MNLSQKYDCALITFRLSTQSICNINNPPNLNQVKTCKELIAENYLGREAKSCIPSSPLDLRT